MVRGGKRAGAPSRPVARRASPEEALIGALGRLVQGALERDPELDEMTVLGAVLRFGASLAARAGQKHGGDAEQFALACEELYRQQAEALGGPEGAG